MRVLVTGLAGFTGFYVKHELERHGYTVIGLESDLLDVPSLEKEIEKNQPDAVVHLAAISFVAHGDAAAFYQVNVIGTLNLLSAVHKHCPNIQSILLASSAHVYGNQDVGVLTEASSLMPRSDYAVSKMAMEKMAELWFDRLPLFIVRPFNYTGCGQAENFLVPKIVAHFKGKQTDIALGNLDVYREFNDVRFVAEVYRKLLDAKPHAQIINVCSGVEHALQDILQACEQVTGHTLKVTVNPKFVRDNEVKSLRGSCDLLEGVVGSCQPKRLEETLRWMLSA